MNFNSFTKQAKTLATIAMFSASALFMTAADANAQAPALKQDVKAKTEKPISVAQEKPIFAMHKGQPVNVTNVYKNNGISPDDYKIESKDGVFLITSQKQNEFGDVMVYQATMNPTDAASNGTKFQYEQASQFKRGQLVKSVSTSLNDAKVHHMIVADGVAHKYDIAKASPGDVISSHTEFLASLQMAKPQVKPSMQMAIK
jgi:hypothetical protein